MIYYHFEYVYTLYDFLLLLYQLGAKGIEEEGDIFNFNICNSNSITLFSKKYLFFVIPEVGFEPTTSEL